MFADAPTPATTEPASLAAATTTATVAGHQRSEFLVLRWQVVLKIEILAWVGEGAGRS